ncbi:MAG TPA: 2'-5' RNA ligase family protein [Actinospica sp.]|nr:2'-5' RNA ligase family protein [Actinospica sp.]
MKPFPPPEKVWPIDTATGERIRKWHVYMCPDLDRDTDLAALVATAQQVALSTAPGCVIPVERAWLHATVVKIDPPGVVLSKPDINKFALSLTDKLAGFPPFTVSARAALATKGGVRLSLTGDRPGEPWHLLTEEVGEVVDQHFGRDAHSQEMEAPHISAGYGAMEIDSGIVGSALHRARISQAPVTVDRVHILEVRQQPAEHRYTWNTASAIAIPLGG